MPAVGDSSTPTATLGRRQAAPASSARARRRPVRPVVAGLITVVTLGGCFSLAEVGLRTLSRHALLVLDVEMWRYARLVKSPSDHPRLVERHRPNARARLMGVTVRTDEHGFRRPSAAIETARRPDDRRVAVLGDSLTFGWGVEEDRTFAAQLEVALRERCPAAPATVWNAGVGNSNTPMQLARYDLLVAPREPEWLILGYFVNDAEPDPEPATNPILWHSSLANLLATRWAQGTHDALRDFRRYYSELYADDDPGWRATRGALTALGRRLAADGVAATLLLLPEMHRPRGHGLFAEQYAAVAEVGRAAGFEVLDSAPAFPPGSGESFWVTPTDAHPDGEAHAIFARTLLTSRHACPSSGTG